MAKRKKLQELTIKDNFMFGAVMVNEDLCKELLELILGFSIEKIIVDKEKSIIYHPEYKGVRLDITASDENHTHYNVEMQVKKRRILGEEADIIIARLMLNYCFLAWNMRNYQILM